MADWATVKSFLYSNYKVHEEIAGGDGLRLMFNTDDLRSQAVYIFHSPLGNGDQWLQVSSPIGNYDSIDLRACLEEASEYVCGGIALVGDLVVFRDAVPMSSLDINELVQPIELIVNTADRLERQFANVDRF
jgi:hypothetical protein